MWERSKSRAWSQPARAVLGVAVLALCVPLQADDSSAPTAGAALEEIVVRASSIHSRLGDVGSKSTLGAQEIRTIAATHINEALARVPGVWVTRGGTYQYCPASHRYMDSKYI
ncbi:MAG: hypothetical protein AAF513_02190 [Pseudomonadota bacterium]